MEKTIVDFILLKGEIAFEGGQLEIMPIKINSYLKGLENVVSNDSYGKNFDFEIEAYDEDVEIIDTVGKIYGRYFDLVEMHIDGVHHAELMDNIDQSTWNMYESTIYDKKQGHFENMYIIDSIIIKEKYRNMKIGTASILMLEEMIKAQFNRRIGIIVLESSPHWHKDETKPSEEELEKLNEKVLNFWKRLGFKPTEDGEYMYFNTDFDMRKINEDGGDIPFDYTENEYLKFSNSKSVFIFYKNRKSQGFKLNIEHLTKEELFMMWAYEDKTDKIIAMLFDTTIPKVTYLREKYGITKENQKNQTPEINEIIINCIRLYGI